MKYLPQNYILILGLILTNCTTTVKNQSEDTPYRETFVIPFIKQTNLNEPRKLFESNSLQEAMFWTFGKYKFSDTIIFDGFVNKELIKQDDIIDYVSKLSIDDTFNTDGFQIYADYTTSIQNNIYDSDEGKLFFPVYVVNESKRTKKVILKDGRFFGIQEAIDTSTDLWCPIEYKEFELCGNGYFGLKVHPHEFLLVLVPKYKGNTKQLMRTRLQNGQNTYLSPTYMGYFNYDQFYLKDEHWNRKDIKTDLNYYIENLFFGAIPKEFN